MGPSRGMSHRTSTLGRMTPLFWGGRSRHFRPSRVRSVSGRFKAANHIGIKDIKEGGFAAFLVKSHVTPPPLSV